jgi:hypothetical protein
MAMKETQTRVEAIGALRTFPYFVLKNEIQTGYNVYTSELLEIQQNYIAYRKGAEFITEGSGGDYVPSKTRFKKAKTLIDKEARFMFSQTPDTVVKARNMDEAETEQVERYQKLIDKMLEKCSFSKTLIQSAKDCFIGKRVACLVDVSEQDGVQIHFYSPLQFYYETADGTDRLTKFISFENATKTNSYKERRYIVNKYTAEGENVTVSSILYDGTGNVIEELIPEKQIDLTYIPAVIIINDGTLEEKAGVSEIADLVDYERTFSMLANADVDCDRKGMNPIRYVVDMNANTTKNLSSSAGSFWDLKSEQNQNNVSPMVGVLSPSMQHTESLKATLDRINTSMYGELDIPNISEETLVGSITSGKALKALYWSLIVRCDEKMKTWIPAIKFIVRTAIDLALLNVDIVKTKYGIEDLKAVEYEVTVQENYALLDDETEEKTTDLSEIAANARSRKSYIKKWRKEECLTDEQINEELIQIALENNMMDSLSANTQVQEALNNMATDRKVEKNIEEVKTQAELEQQEQHMNNQQSDDVEQNTEQNNE